MIVLHEWFQDAEVGKGALVVAFQKKTTIVAKDARFEEEDSGEAGGGFFHGTILSAIPALRRRAHAANSADRLHIRCCALAAPGLPVAQPKCSRSGRRFPPGRRPSGPGASPRFE